MSRDVYGDYNNQRLFATLGTGTYTLQTANKVMISDVVIHSTDAKLTVTYNNSNIVDTENDGVYTLKTKGKKCSTDIVVNIQEKTPAGFSVTINGNRYDVYDGSDDTGTLLGTHFYYNDTATYTFSSGYIFLKNPTGDRVVSTGTLSGGVTFVSQSGSNLLYKVTGNGTINNAHIMCMIKGTKITMSDGSTKNVEDITYDDELLVWNFYEDKLDKAKPMWIMQPKIANEYNLLEFSNGTKLGLCGSNGYHRIYNDEAKEFTHTGTKDTPIGTHTFCQDGSYTELVKQTIINKDVEYYNIITDKHYNLFANGILTSCRLSNRYVIDNMKYTSEVKMTEQEVNDYIKELSV